MTSTELTMENWNGSGIITSVQPDCDGISVDFYNFEPAVWLFDGLQMSPIDNFQQFVKRVAMIFDFAGYDHTSLRCGGMIISQQVFITIRTSIFNTKFELPIQLFQPKFCQCGNTSCIAYGQFIPRPDITTYGAIIRLFDLKYPNDISIDIKFLGIPERNDNFVIFANECPTSEVIFGLEGKRRNSILASVSYSQRND
jgi:hypothetical protein